MLYSKSNPVFYGTSADVANSIFYSMRVTWRESDIVPGPPDLAPTPANGETLVYNIAARGGTAAGITAELVAKHPTLSGIYYYRQVSINTIITYPELQTSSGETVLDNTDSRYTVIGTSGDVGVLKGTGSDVVCVYNPRRVAELNGLVLKLEPFNVVFDTHQSAIGVEKQSFKFISKHTTLTVNGSVSITNKDAELYFIVRDNTLGFTVKKDTQQGEDTDYIKSINGVTPVDGNINIRLVFSDAGQQ